MCRMFRFEPASRIHVRTKVVEVVKNILELFNAAIGVLN